MSYPGHSLGEPYPFAEMQSVLSAYWDVEVRELCSLYILIYIFVQFFLKGFFVAYY